MSKYCCFLCPSTDFKDKLLTDVCPECGNEYGFPLEHYPRTIGNYEVVEAISRGFYATAYKVRAGKLGIIKVLKVSPVAVYEYHGKDFAAECEFHNSLSRESAHVVQIDDYSEIDIEFRSIGSIRCHVALLDYVSGQTLEQFLQQPRSMIPTYTVAQIALDLLRLLDEIHIQNKNHNDLHANNIIVHKLGEDRRRAGELDGTIRAIAVDLGSASEDSKSAPNNARFGDQHWLAGHLFKLSECLRLDPDTTDDLDFRVASVLEEKARMLASTMKEQRLPSMEETIDEIQGAIQHAFSPWKAQLILKRFGDTYNALTLSPWFVPLLLVDPDGAWVSRISTHGPQVITGMRGCGKTIILRALQFHARATAKDEESEENVLRRLKNDDFVGLFISCNRLLENPIDQKRDLTAPFELLLVAYTLETLNAVRHLQEIDKDVVNPLFPRILSQQLHPLISNLKLPDIVTDHELERYLRRILIDIQNPQLKHELTCSPTEAFTSLAVAVRQCSSIWTNSNVLFLLDDVTTRYINISMAKDILSNLLFQSEICAFKLTTETQMLNLGFSSPGGIEPARSGRDFELFDLGVEVYSRTNGRNGKKFINDILAQRARYYANHPKARPAVLLGDTSLLSLAKGIATAKETSSLKKRAYWGISALAAVCVGDIGDVILIYEQILRKAHGSRTPINPSVQTDAYLDLCSRRLYELNRRNTALKDTAMQFAEASHKLLVESARSLDTDNPRIRQYSKIYVRITSGDRGELFSRLRELIDCGAFVYSGGAPRTKVRDGDPLHQFKLTFRRILGLSNYIGLAESDRFELSGEALENWLSQPEIGSTILLNNLSKENEEDSDQESEEDSDQESDDSISRPQTTLEFETETVGDVFKRILPKNIHGSAKVRAYTLDMDEIRRISFNEILLGLGFEDRAVESAHLLFNNCKIDNAIAFDYGSLERTSEIMQIAESHKCVVKTVKYDDMFSKSVPFGVGNTLVNISGLAKPLIFKVVRQALRNSNKVWIAHTQASTYYPTRQALDRVFEAKESDDTYTLLEALGNVFTGEKGPYFHDRLIASDSDEMRRRVLIAFASAKHERLLSVLEKRDYDSINIVVPKSNTSRSRLARMAAGIAASESTCADIDRIDTDDLHGLLNHLVERYQHWYMDGGTNVEIALTGSKLQTVASAAVSAVYKLSQVWHVRPEFYDKNKFTSGIGKTHFFRLEVDPVSE